jgi:predicted permease
VKRTLLARGYALLTRIVPAQTRARYGKDMVDAFEVEQAAARQRSRIEAVRFAGAAYLDLLNAGLREHRRLRARRALDRRTDGSRASRLGGPWTQDIGQDLRFAGRSLWKSRGFATVAVFSLSLGLGVSTAMFTIVDQTWLRPVPGLEAASDGIVEILPTLRGAERGLGTWPDFLDLGDADLPLAHLAGWKGGDGTMGTDAGGAPVRLGYVSASYFAVLGIRPSRGRAFLPSEDVGPGQHRVAIVSHDMWRNRLGADPDILGRTVVLNRTPYTVVGVAPEGFRHHRKLDAPFDFWLPMMQHPWLLDPEQRWLGRDVNWLHMIARLEEGATPADATAALEVAYARLEAAYPQTNEWKSAKAVAFGPVPALGRDEGRAIMAGFFVLIGVVLLIVCGNVAGMVLARSATRERELALRMALGSGRGRLVRLAMVEAMLIALAGGALGVVLSYWGTTAAFLAMENRPPDVSFQPNATILAFSLAMALGTTLVIGLFPALRFSGSDLLGALKDDAGGGSRRVGRVHHVAASAQTGLALVLIVLSVVLVRAMGAHGQRDLGFEPRDLHVSFLDLGGAGKDDEVVGRAFLDRVRDAVESVPGVRSVALADGLPLDLVGNYTRVGRAEDADEDAGKVLVEFTLAGEAFFETVGTPVRRGRGFTRQDGPSSEPVVVITEPLAERLWPGEDPVGRRVSIALPGRDARQYTVVGVTGHVASSRPTESRPHVFVSLEQAFATRIAITVRGNNDDGALGRAVEQAILSVDPEIARPRLVASEALVDLGLAGQRSGAQASAGLGLLALLLSAIGVYGVVAFGVATRTREIGIRMAMGATRAGVVRSVLRDAVRLALPGLGVGAVVAVGVAASMGSQLLGVSPADPTSLLVGAAVLFAVVILASWIPARRASRIQPVDALGSE